MSLALKVVNGRVLLKNTTDNLWYYVDVELLGGNPTLRIAQTSTALEDESLFLAYFVLKCPTDGVYFKVQLQTFEGGVTYYPTEENIPFTRLFLKDDDGATYEVIITSFEGSYLLQVIPAATDTGTITLPWRAITPVDYKTEVTVITPGG